MQTLLHAIGTSSTAEYVQNIVQQDLTENNVKAVEEFLNTNEGNVQMLLGPDQAPEAAPQASREEANQLGDEEATSSGETRHPLIPRPDLPR